MTTYPYNISIEATRLCNLRCTMCPTHSANADPAVAKKYPPYFDWEMYKSLIDQMVSWGVPIHVSPQFQGEPLLCKNVFDMVKLAKSKGFATGFSTNGVLMDDEKTRQLIDSGLDSLTISMDGVSKAVFEKIRVGADYDKIVLNVENLLKVRQGKPSVAINGVRMPENAREIDKLVDRWLPLVDQVSISNVWSDGGVPEKYFLPKRFACPSLWQNMIILTNGDVIPCCNPLFNEVMGNVFDASLSEIWQGRAYKQFRILHTNGRWDLIPSCRRCDTWMTGVARKRIEKGRMVQVSPFHKVYTVKEPVSFLRRLIRR